MMGELRKIYQRFKKYRMKSKYSVYSGHFLIFLTLFQFSSLNLITLLFSVAHGGPTITQARPQTSCTTYFVYYKVTTELSVGRPVIPGLTVDYELATSTEP